MACLDELKQQPNKKWVGTSKTGERRTFETLGQYNEYIEALGCPPIRPAVYVPPNPGKNTIPTGFLEFKPRDAETQARFDALSATWEGPEASEEAVKQGLYKEDSADAATREKKPQPIKESFTNLCSIQ